MKALALVAVAAAIGAASAPAAQAPLRVVGFATIGTLKVRGAGPAEARKAFGRPTKVRDLHQSCRYSWPGIEIGFYTLFHEQQCHDWSAFSEAKITRPWVTDRGLKQGDSVVKAKRLYPAARRPGRNLGIRGGIGLIVPFSQAIGDYGLGAGTRGGRVTTLYIFDPQGGE